MTNKNIGQEGLIKILGEHFIYSSFYEANITLAPLPFPRKIKQTKPRYAFLIEIANKRKKKV